MIAVGQSINRGHCEHRLDNTSVSTCSTSLLTSPHTAPCSRTMSCTVMLLLLLLVMMMMKVVVESTATWMKHSHQLLQRDVKRPSSVAIIDAINWSLSPTPTSYTSSSTDHWPPTAPTSTFSSASTVSYISELPYDRFSRLPKQWSSLVNRNSFSYRATDVSLLTFMNVSNAKSGWNWIVLSESAFKLSTMTVYRNLKFNCYATPMQ